MSKIKMDPATIHEMVEVARYWRECARDEFNGITGVGKTIQIDYSTTLARTYMAKAIELEVLIERDITLKVERLKDVHAVSTGGKTIPLFQQERQRNNENGGAFTMAQRTETGKEIDAEKAAKKEPNLAKKESNKKKPIYKHLAEVPLKEEQKDEIATSWKENKGNKAKTALYEKVRDLMNYYEHSVADIRSEIGSFVHAHDNNVRKENNIATLESLEKQGLKAGFEKVKLDKLAKGDVLLSDKCQYTVEDDQFNLLLLTGYDSLETVPPADYAKLQAIYYRVTNREAKAIKTIQDFFGTEKVPMAKEIAFLYLNAITKEILNKPLEQLVKNILVHKAVTGKPTEGVSNAKKLLEAYSRHKVTVPVAYDPETKQPNKFEERIKVWGEGKLTNFIDKCLNELYKAKILTKPVEPAKKRPAKKEEPKGENSKEESGSSNKGNKKASGANGTAKPAKQASNGNKANNAANSKSPGNNTKPKSDDNGKSDKSKNTAKTVKEPAKKQSTPKAAPNKGEEKTSVPAKSTAASGTGGKEKKATDEREKLKQAKKEAKQNGGNGKMTTIARSSSDTPSISGSKESSKGNSNKFQAIIYQNPKSLKYGCYIKDFKDEVHIKNVNDPKRIPQIFSRALAEYIKKARRINDKAKGSNSTKGRIYKMLPVDLKAENIEYHNAGTQAV